uniref:Uncharacterized protein n=1 Tax=viral metagenome TaxID=1070528 RepID=A0A6C0BS40_9ZZZZ
MYTMEHILIISIIIFLVIYGIIVMYKPVLIYKDDGTLRDFGVGYKNKTPIPLWFVSILLAIITYISVRYIYVYT